MQPSQQTKKIPLEHALDKFTDIIEKLIPNMPKDIKHTWGHKLLDLDLLLYELLYIAKDFPEQRHTALRQLKNKFFLIQTILRKAHNNGYISTNAYINTHHPANNIEKQLVGWIKALPASDLVTTNGEC